MPLIEHDVIDSSVGQALAAEAWKFYSEVFADVHTLAAQRHLMTFTEFCDVLEDPHIRKYLVFDESGALVGMSTLTNHLGQWPLISPAYFERRWPEHYHRGAIWYCGFVGARGSLTAFHDMVVAMWQQISSNNGISFQDYCSINVEVRKLPQAAQRLLRRAGFHVDLEQVDAQSFWMLSPSAPDTDPTDAELEAEFLGGGREVIV